MYAISGLIAQFLLLTGSGPYTDDANYSEAEKTTRGYCTSHHYYDYHYYYYHYYYYVLPPPTTNTYVERLVHLLCYAYEFAVGPP